MKSIVDLTYGANSEGQARSWVKGLGRSGWEVALAVPVLWSVRLQSALDLAQKVIAITIAEKTKAGKAADEGS